MLNEVKLGPTYIPLVSQNKAAALARVYVGHPDTDPVVVSNQKTLYALQESGVVVAVTQPIYTSVGGVPLYMGSPVTLLVDGAYSMRVLDSTGAQVYFVPISVNGQSSNLSYWLSDYDALADALTDIGTTNATFTIDKALALVAGTTFPATLTTKILPGAVISGAFTLTPQGYFEGSEGCIDSTVTCDFSGVKNAVDAEWFSSLEKAQEANAPHLRINKEWSISAVVDFDANNTKIEFSNLGKISTTDDTVDGIKISGNGCSVINPVMQGPGTFVQDNSSDAALIRVTGDDVEISGGRLTNPPTAGVHVESADRANIHHLNINGGIAAKTSTFHFGVKIEESIGSKVTNCVIKDCVQGVKNSQTITNRHTEVANNYIQDCFDHAIYGGGTYENFHHNQIYHSRTGAGTAIIGQESYGNYSDNEIYSVDGGISVRDAIGARANNNSIIITTSVGTVLPIGIKMGRNTDGDVQYCNVTGNTILFNGTDSSDGILFQASGATNTVDYCSVNNNTIYKANQTGGNAAIYLCSIGEGQQNHITGNIIDSPEDNGIETLYIKNSIISYNTIKNANIRQMQLIDTAFTTVAHNIFLDEAGSVSTSGILETDSTDVCHGNRYLFNSFLMTGLAGSAKINTTSSDFSYMADINGKSFTATGTTTAFYLTDGTTLFFDPAGTTGRNFDPTGDFPVGYTVVVVNTADAAETLDFNSTGINQAVAQNERATFAFNGTAWVLVNLD